MAETANIAQIASKISNDIFKAFFWESHPQQDVNFECVLEEHKSQGGARKLTHPADVVFHYFDPYLDKLVYLHTDLKSYKKSSIRQAKIRDALISLSQTVACCAVSDSWKQKFLLTQNSKYEVRGLLFVANHDNKAKGEFWRLLKGIAKANLPVARGHTLHVLGPDQISNLFCIAADLKLQVADKKAGAAYRFFYPDLTLWKRHTVDDARVAATIELLLSPYFIVRYPSVEDSDGTTVARRGSIVYYGRAGETVQEFIYLLDALSRYQLISSHEDLRIRVFSQNKSETIKNNFNQAKSTYCETWHFSGPREAEIQAITIDSIPMLAPNYSPDEIGWRE